MNGSTQPDPTRGSPGILRKPGLRKAAFILFALVTAIALFYAEENWRGRRAWKHRAEELSRQGERLDWFALVPAPVPNDQNFAATPFFAPLFDFVPNRKPGQRPWRDPDAFDRTMAFAKGLPDPRDKGSWQTAQKLDLAAWQRTSLTGKASVTNSLAGETSTNRAEAAKWIMTRLAEYDPLLAEIRNASTRPYARFSVRYDEPNPMSILLPHLSVLRNVCQILQVRAAAELELGRTAEALDDALLVLTISDSLKTEPLLVSYLVRLANAGTGIQIIWEGMVDGRWSATQVEQIKARLAKYDFISDVGYPLQAERAGCLRFISYIQNVPNPGDEVAGLVKDIPLFCIRLIPSGWFDFEKVNYVNLYQQFVSNVSEESFRPRGAMLRQAKAADSLVYSPSALFWRHSLFSSLLLPALGKMHLKTAEAQNGVHLAFTASSLEQYKQRHGHYPESLVEVAEKEKLANDVITGELLKYRRDGADRFVLYSVGSDEHDDNGTVPKHAGAAERNDWVWTWPAKN